jgi:Mg-chelatase subunit ChlD
MQPFLLSLRARRWHGRLTHQLGLLTAALVLALLACLMHIQPVAAQSDCAGGRTQQVDRNGNGMIDSGETFTLDLCRQITFSIGGVDKTARVYYTTGNGVANDRLTDVDSNGDGTNDFTAQQIADQIVIWTRDAWTIYRNYGFNDPMGRNDMNVHVFDMRAGLAGWCCSPDNYEIDVPSVLPGFRFGGDRRGPASIVFHEMWHAAEWSPNFGCWVNEGTASTMTDHVDSQLDIFNGNDFIGRVRGYLGWGTETSLVNHCYDGALWWKYFMQETGAINTNLDQGVNSMHDFWRDGGATDFTRMDNVIRSRGGGRTFESLWIDFAVANYAKEYSGPVVTSRYRYLDEQEASAPDYPAPRLTGSFNVISGTQVGPTLTDIAAWSSQYYQFTINPAVPIINLEVRQDANKRLGYVLLLMRNNDIVQEIREVGRDFVRSFANASYTRVVLIVVGLNELANYRYAVNATTPVLNILDPLRSRQALAGRIDAPGKILVKVEVLSPSGAGTPIAGIDPNTFTLTVGSRVVQPGDRISAAYVQGQYWLLMRAPTQTVTGDYNLRVNYGALTDTEDLAVRYQDRNDFDNVLVIDRSGSMGFFGGAPMQSAKDAARLYVDSWRVGDKVGVVSFADTADNPAPLTLRDWDMTSRNDAHNAINALTPNGGTCIGCGAQKGLDELVAGGSAAHSWAMIVLSDGRENVGAITDFLNVYNARRNNGEQVPVVHTVALGPDADRARMENLAVKTGGTFSFAAIPAGGAQAAAVQAETLSNNLGEIYRMIGEEVAGQQQVYAATSTGLEFGDVQTHTIPVDGAASEAIFVVKVDTTLVPLRATLFEPNGTPHPTPDLVDDRHLVWRIAAPPPGDWKMELLNVGFPIPLAEAAAATQEDEYLVEAAVSSELTLDVYLGLPVEERLVGKPMPIFAALAGTTPISGATVSALVSAPNGVDYTVAMYDDGAHGDGGAGDGFYANTFYQTHYWGSYDVVVTASEPLGSEPFLRRQRISFNMLETRELDDPNIDPNIDPNTNPDDPMRPDIDTDDDGMPDWWEEEHGLDPNSDDAGGDPDHDGLTNEDEYGHGTDPNHSDTDGGGQNDGSEVMTPPPAKNPLDPADDEVSCPRFFKAETVYHDRDEHIDAHAVVLYYDVAAEHRTVNIWRSPIVTGTLDPIAQDAPATGIYSDTTTALNTPYFYWLSAENELGHASCILGPEEIKRTEDPIEPEGVVMINEGALSTFSLNVTLNLNATPDATEMQVRNQPDFSETEGWEPYNPIKRWILEPEGDLGSVFVLFRDEAGNVSEPESDTIAIMEAETIFLPLVTTN